MRSSDWWVWKVATYFATWIGCTLVKREEISILSVLVSTAYYQWYQEGELVHFCRFLRNVSVCTKSLVGSLCRYFLGSNKVESKRQKEHRQSRVDTGFDACCMSARWEKVSVTVADNPIADRIRLFNLSFNDDDQRGLIARAREKERYRRYIPTRNRIPRFLMTSLYTMDMSVCVCMFFSRNRSSSRHGSSLLVVLQF